MGKDCQDCIYREKIKKVYMEAHEAIHEYEIKVEEYNDYFCEIREYHRSEVQEQYLKTLQEITQAINQKLKEGIYPGDGFTFTPEFPEFSDEHLSFYITEMAENVCIAIQCLYKSRFSGFVAKQGSYEIGSKKIKILVFDEDQE